MDDCKCNDLKDYKAKVEKNLLADWKTLVQGVLDISQLTTSPSQWSIVRSKILRLANDFVRKLRDELDLELDDNKDKD